jgi:hypothetical protein
MSALSNFLAAELLDHVLRGETYTPPETVYLALNPSDPGPGGDPASELMGGSYERQPIDFASASSDSGSNIAVTFVALPESTIPWVSLHDAISGGNMLFRIPVDGDPFEIAEGGSLVLEVGEVVVAMD